MSPLPEHFVAKVIQEFMTLMIVQPRVTSGAGARVLVRAIHAGYGSV